MRAPSGEKAALLTLPSCQRTPLIFGPAAASQIRAVRSPEAVTKRAPSGEKAALLTLSSCPRRTLISLPVVASQSPAVRPVGEGRRSGPSAEQYETDTEAAR